MHIEKGVIMQTTWKPEHIWCRPTYKSKYVSLIAYSQRLTYAREPKTTVLLHSSNTKARIGFLKLNRPYIHQWWLKPGYRH